MHGNLAHSALVLILRHTRALIQTAREEIILQCMKISNMRENECVELNLYSFSAVVGIRQQRIISVSTYIITIIT